MKKVMMILTNGFEPDMRVYREAKYYSESSFEVDILCWDRANEYPIKEQNYDDKIRIIRHSTNTKYGSGFKQLKSFFSYLRFVRKYLKNNNPVIAHYNDLDGLFAGLFGNFQHKRKNLVKVYDSHEFEIERLKAKSKLVYHLAYLIENSLIRKVDFVITVNKSIATDLMKIHKLSSLPIVLRNIPEEFEIDKNKVLRIRQNYQLIHKKYKFNKLIMYHGYVTYGRGLENLIKAMANLKNILLIIKGKGEKGYLDSLKKLTIKFKVNHCVVFDNASDWSSLGNYIAAVDIGIVCPIAINKSYFYGLPNKLFEYIACEKPIVGSNYPEISKIVQEYNIGILTNPDNPIEIANAIDQIFSERNLDRFNSNIIKAKELLTWKNEKKKLKEITDRAYQNDRL